MPVRGTKSRQRGVAVVSGQAKDDDNDSKQTTGGETNKYDKRRRRMTAQRTQYLGLAIVLVTLFMLARYLTYGSRERQDRYARAQALLRDARLSDARHQGRRRHHPHQQQQPFEADDDEANQQQQYGSSSLTSHELAQQFQVQRTTPGVSTRHILKEWTRQLRREIQDNVHGGIRWIRPYLLPGNEDLNDEKSGQQKAPKFRGVSRLDGGTRMKWQDEYEELLSQHDGVLPGPPVDYTDPGKYRYPDLMYEPPALGGYPKLTPLADLMAAWDQDEDNPDVITETLLHFNFSDPDELAMAANFRDAMVPFKLTNVPELLRANRLWTDEYVTRGFAQADNKMGNCQESPNHYFAFFVPPKWNEATMGLPPYETNDWDYATWAQHARYADARPLAEDQFHAYFQAGVPPAERTWSRDERSFISRDLPSFSATEPNFIMFHPEHQKGIQCRFGERGVVAATHYDGGRNMVGMITGAKRYILSPPTACGKLGIFPRHKSPIYRHSLLDFGHIKYLTDPEHGRDMPGGERAWLERAAKAPAVETVLKAGEILFIPSYWFHYIVSIQKSAQCNARSGIEDERHAEFGGLEEVTQFCQPDDS